METIRESLRIILLSVVAAMIYGILHDQITARVCVEYFTIGHPQLFVIPTNDPTRLGIGWGIVATWWVGMPLGIALAVAAQVGARPPRTARSVIMPITTLLSIMAVGALAAGLIGWLLARRGTVFLLNPLAELVPREKHSAFLADLWAHSASYLVGIVGGIVLVICTWRSRKIPSSLELMSSGGT
jgi:hypothetical protein